ncbi:putative proteasome subunit alpha type-3 [Apostichopus japonicus]|uniref:Proteasome subunit alpha type n=1 Tax=Stichopus japonicus TaxID=307972 RepID=A0A2G8LA32_STIJA|nr:putative proteasome subunit alpha type-3 [Apostichopus japonicus]
MSSIGTGYDLSASQFSPDGRVFQVEYALKAVENSGTAIGVRCKDGVVFGVEKLVMLKLYETGTNKRIFHIDRHIGMYLADRVAMYVHAYTLYSAVRPFGCSVMLGSFSEDTPQLHMIDPSGVFFGYHGCAIGKARQAAKTEVEKFLTADKHFKDMTCEQVVKEVAKMIYVVHDEVKDKAFELELSWVGKRTNGRHEVVPKEIADEAIAYGKQALEESSSSDDDDL